MHTMTPSNGPASTKDAMRENFISDEEHFQRMLEALPRAQRDAFNSLKHARVDTAFVGRRYVIYEVKAGQPVVKDIFTVVNFDAYSGETFPPDDAGFCMAMRGEEYDIVVTQRV